MQCVKVRQFDCVDFLFLENKQKIPQKHKISKNNKNQNDVPFFPTKNDVPYSQQ